VSRTFTLSNGSAGGSFAITTIGVTKNNSGNGTYSITGGTCVAGTTTLAASGNCTVIVQFASPNGNNTTTGTLTVAGTGAGGVGNYSVSRTLTGN
jgi:hypothetical protein